MNELDKILAIDNTRCYFDDGDLDKEEFEKLKEKINKALKLVRLTKKWSKDESWSHSEVCKDLLKEVKI